MNLDRRWFRFFKFMLWWGVFCVVSMETIAGAREKQHAMVEIPFGFFIPLYRPSDADKKNTSGPEKISVMSFWMDVHPVTNAEYLRFVKKNPRWQKSQVPRVFAEKNYLGHWKSDTDAGIKAPPDAPVVNVSWFAARAYCQSLRKKLPTVSQWEYVAQADEVSHDASTKHKFIDRILQWYSKPNQDILPRVSSNFRNVYGVHDMHGLVWEWTQDFNTALVTGESRGDSSLERALYCGSGSIGASNFRDYAAFMRYGFRSSLKADYVMGNLGFRCVKGASQKRETAYEKTNHVCHNAVSVACRHVI